MPEHISGNAYRIKRDVWYVSEKQRKLWKGESERRQKRDPR